MLSLIILLVAFVTIAKCDLKDFCYNQCITKTPSRNSNGNINIYFEYKKAVINVPFTPRTLPILKGPGGYPSDFPFFHTRERERAPQNVNPVKEKCSQNRFSSTKKQAKCKPRPFIMDVVSHEGKVNPSKVLTKQCSGLCQRGGRKCLPIQSRNISMSVQVITDEGNVHCATILVPEDIKCKCQCPISPKDCTAKQDFHANTCSCTCSNKEEKSHCVHKKQKIDSSFDWDPKTCSCVCSKEGFCTTGTFWDNVHCKCMPRTDKGRQHLPVPVHIHI